MQSWKKALKILRSGWRASEQYLGSANLQGRNFIKVFHLISPDYFQSPEIPCLNIYVVNKPVFIERDYTMLYMSTSIQDVRCRKLGLQAEIRIWFPLDEDRRFIN